MSGTLLPAENVEFDENTFFITDAGDGIALCGHKTKCNTCGRKILVQLPLFGVPHHMDALVVCGECLVIDESFRQAHPELAEDLEKWATG